MQQQIFTNEVMAILSGGALVWFLVVIGILIRWHDWDVLWMCGIATMQGILFFYYVELSLNGVNLIETFSIVGLLPRPALFGYWLIIGCYTIYRLITKSRMQR